MGNASGIAWEYGGGYTKVDMSGVIMLPNDSRLMVCDLTKMLPDFMKEADTLFIDPPCSQGNLKSFHTKAGNNLGYCFSDFEESIFQRVLEISPKYLFLEVFKSNKKQFETRCREIYKSVVVYESTYYGSKKNKCWILQCTNEGVTEYDELHGMDEAKAIEWICKNHNYDCIGDLCMGKGLVGRFAYAAGKKFVGTELNEKRLGVLVDHIKNGTKWTVK
jgi:hypothetical protein